MKLKLFVFLFILILSLVNGTVFSSVPTAGDTIFAPRILGNPVIDGSGNDACWDSAAWNPMPYVWIPYGQTMSPSDFTGRFKIVWNDRENLLYLLFEITDDKFVNGYAYSTTNGNYYLYDVIEIFIDEDHSGGNHMTNNNAFAYHITGGNSTVNYDACDMWSNVIVNYKDHFPEFARVQTGNVYTWEFSLMVITDSYTPGLDPLAYKATLSQGKKMGFTAAYCDDDQSSSKPNRDNFIASKYQTFANSNNSYIDASIFGLLQLVNEPTSGNNTGSYLPLKEDGRLTVFPNPVPDRVNISVSDIYRGRIELSVYDCTGNCIIRTGDFKSQETFRDVLDFTNLDKGLYIIKLSEGSENKLVKLIR